MRKLATCLFMSVLIFGFGCSGTLPGTSSPSSDSEESEKTAGTDDDSNVNTCIDADGDNYCRSQCESGQCLVDPSKGDCNDSDPNVHPGAKEVCDGVDNDCDGKIDEEVKTTYYRDQDGDGFGDPSKSKESCSQPAGYISQGGDCDDSDSSIAPTATEVCDGVDNDCDSQTDEDLNPPKSSKQQGVCKGSRKVCKGQQGWQDPDFTQINDYEQNESSCDGKDNDCDGDVDESTVVCPSKPHPKTCQQGSCQVKSCSSDQECSSVKSKYNICSDSGSYEVACSISSNQCVVFEDKDCDGSQAGTESICDDGVDGDLDGKVDCNDPDCSGSTACGTTDSDGDGVANSADQCSGTSSGATVDSSGCSDAQVDQDGDGVCDPNAASSGPSNCSGSDNCTSTANQSQSDLDSDGTGDACDSDRDGDTVANSSDNCPDTANQSQTDSDGDGTGDACEDKLTLKWKPGSEAIPSNVKTLYLKAECKSGSGFVLSWPSGANGHDSTTVDGNDKLSHTVQLSNGVSYCKMNVAGADSSGNIVWWNPGTPHGSVGKPSITLKGKKIIPSANSNGFGGLQWEIDPGSGDTDADGSCDPGKSGSDCSGTDSAPYDGTTQ